MRTTSLTIAKSNINIIWFGFGNISYDLMKEIKTKSPHLKLICDTDSVWSDLSIGDYHLQKV